MPPPVPATLTFRELYNKNESDPFHGHYQRVMAEFSMPAVGGAWDADATLEGVLGMGNATNAYVGLFHHDDHPEGRTRLLHDPQKYPTIIGHRTPYDGEVYAFHDEVVGQTATTVLFPEDAFERSADVLIPPDHTQASAAWAADTALVIQDPVTAPAGGVRARVPKLMYVPPAYIRLFIGRRLAPRDLIEQVVATIVTDGRKGPMEPFIRWCIYAGTASTDGGDHSDILLDEPIAPIGDANFMEWRAERLDIKLPELAGHGDRTRAEATVRIANLMTDILREQRGARVEANQARTDARAPKTVEEYFKGHMTAKIMNMCAVNDAAHLPDLYKEIAEANGKRDREVVEITMRAIANVYHVPELAPVVTPSLAKKIACLRFAGSNMDDLDEGISPFSVVIMDHTTTSGTAAYNSALEAAHDYDDLTKGTGTADLSDLKATKGGKALIPETFTLARAMLQSFKIVLFAILGDDHLVATEYDAFLAGYINRENFYTGRLQLADQKLGPARLLRYVQLVTRAWFQGAWEAVDANGVNRVPRPDYSGALTKMSVGDMAWLPVMPPQYLKAPAPSPASGETATPRRQTQITNPAINRRFEDFRTGISQTKFNEAIRRVGEPPKVTRSGRECVMCASYHLRGTCFSNCKRAADHGPHSAEEDNLLYGWCERAFA